MKDELKGKDTAVRKINWEPIAIVQINGNGFLY